MRAERTAGDFVRGVLALMPATFPIFLPKGALPTVTPCHGVPRMIRLKGYARVLRYPDLRFVWLRWAVRFQRGCGVLIPNNGPPRKPRRAVGPSDARSRVLWDARVVPGTTSRPRLSTAPPTRSRTCGPWVYACAQQRAATCLVGAGGAAYRRRLPMNACAVPFFGGRGVSRGTWIVLARHSLSLDCRQW